MHGNDDFFFKLELILAYIKELLKFQRDVSSKQEEIFALVRNIDGILQVNKGSEDIWLTKAAVMEALCITESTFYRRQAAGDWQRRRSGNTWYYLKSSLISS